MCTNFQTKRTFLKFWTEIWPKMGSGFQKSKSGFGINTSKIPCMPFFIQNGHILIFCSKFGEIAQLRVIFWFKYCSVFCRELVEAEMSQVEVDGSGWSWVHGLVIPINCFIYIYYAKSCCKINLEESQRDPKYFTKINQEILKAFNNNDNS